MGAGAVPKRAEKSIFRRPGTRCWHVRYTDPDGHTIRRSARTEDYAEAQAFLAGLQGSGGLTFADAAAQYFSRHPMRPTTRANYLSALRQWHPFVGHLMLSHITTRHVQAFMRASLRHMAPQSVAIRVRFLSGVFEFARHYLQAQVVNPVHAVGKLRLPRSPERIRWLSDEEVERVLAAAASPLRRDIIVLALETGMRLREIINLRVQEIDLAHRRVFLPSTRTKAKRGRVVPLSDTAFGTVAQRLREAPASGYLFGDPVTGEPPRGAKWWPAVATRAGLNDVHFHDLRHHFASRYVQRGGRLQVLAMILGHASVQMTMRYAHLAVSDMESEFHRVVNR